MFSPCWSTMEEKIKKNSNNNNKSIFDIYQKSKTSISLVHGHIYWSTFGVHLVKGPKVFQMHFRN